MGLFDGLKAAFGQGQRDRLVSPSGVSVGGRVAYPQRGTYILHVEKGYKANPIVAACVGLLSSTLNEPPLGVARDDGTVDLNHPLSVMFRRPNPYMGQAQFWSQVWQFVNMSGNAYVRIIRGKEHRNATGFLPYGDAHVAPLRDTNGWITDYRYESNGYTETWPAKDVIHIRHPLYIDPLKLDMGMSPIEVAWDKIQTYNELQASIYSLVASNMVPSGMLTAPGDLPTNAITQIREQLRKRKTATGRERTDPLVLGSGMNYVQMGLDAQRLQATETIRELEAAICAAFRIQPAVIGSSAGMATQTYNNMQAAFAEYTTLLRVPLWNAIEEQMEAGLSRDFPGVQLAFDLSQVQALQPDVDAVVYPAIASFNANLTTQNETRAKIGYEPLPDGDKLAFQVIPAPTGFGMLSAAQPETAKDATSDDFTFDGERVKWNEAFAVKAWQDEERMLAKAAAEQEPYAIDLIEKARRGALAKVKADKANPADGVNVEVLVRQYMTATAAAREKLARQIIELTLSSAQVDFAAVQSEVDAIIDAQTRQTASMMKESCETLKSEVSQIAEANAGNQAAIRDEITRRFDTISKPRAAMIARTTVRAQSTVVQNESVKSLNRAETNPNKQFVMVWLSQRDDTVRPSHEELDGKYIESGGTWSIHNAGISKGPGIGPVASETINCRCVQRPTRKSRLG